MARFLYIDNSNVWIEGMRWAAVYAGLAPDIWYAGDRKITDPNWRLDFGKLLLAINGDPKDIKRAVLFGSRPPPNDSLWQSAQRQGYETVIYDRNRSNQEKQVDAAIVATVIEDSYEKMDVSQDEIILVAGDSDYVPMIEKLRKRGFRVKLVFWSHASRELIAAASEFKELNPFLDDINYNKSNNLGS
ncbi:MAG: NYN domain-containing protein [Candidatus Symbiobacter sp.]|nr:NYN domain-containing protein [Candidatus Symbiobacter sp.]